ncbi:Conserved_hypothetical protein [Hexamita inflata]|uniref:Uncharacterized protein n=1 Tax=Hexamita inflata TaxID=28002 RepID=A0AA86TU65_9EUKA|nr:Conserved hypothetical protein [Hexamita inflata]
MQKKADAPQDPAMRREYFQKFGASAINDAHFISIYIDEQLASECGMISPTQLLSSPPYNTLGYTIQQYTSTAQYTPELGITDATKQPVLTLNRPAFYGFWGNVFNSVMDNKPAETYQLLIQFIEHVQANNEAVYKAWMQEDQNTKQPKAGLSSFVFTTLTDSQAKLLLKPIEVAELQGSIRKFLCGRGCCADLQDLNSEYRFPVNPRGFVESVATRVGQDIVDPSYGFKSPLQGIIDRETIALTKPKPKPVIVEKPKEAKKEKPKEGDAEKKPKKPKKAPLDPALYPAGPAPEKLIIKTLQLSAQPVTETQPVCTFCQAPLRFNIQPCKIPTNYKQFITQTSKTLQLPLQPAQVTLISAQHNNYQTNKSQPVAKTLPSQKFVLLELGYNTAFKKVHEENLKTVMQMKGNGFLVRIAKPSDEARTFTFDGIDSYKTNMQLDASFSLDNYCYCVEADSIRQGVIDLMEMFKDRYLWIAEWDDLKKRNDKYFPKKK